jgi:hypothetical protein
LLHQVGDLFELNVKLRCQKVKHYFCVTPEGKLHIFQVSCFILSGFIPQFFE